MRAAILSAGPSLRQTFDPDAHFDLRIGVNSAAAIHFCDWWSCGDAQTFARVMPIGYPALFTITDSDGNFRPREVAERLKHHRMVLWSEAANRVRPPAMWNSWSINAAVVLAVDLGANSIHVYGHDMIGTMDVNGHNLPAREKNWSNVRVGWGVITKWAMDQGVTIFEHQPEAASCK